MNSTDAQAPDDPNQLANKITICHWSNGGHWNQITVSENALGGHDNHQWDIWPPVDGVTDGQNWGRGENVYMNGCQTTTLPSPTATPTITPSESESPTMSESPSATDSMSPLPTGTLTESPSSSPSPIPCESLTGGVSSAMMGVVALAMIGSAFVVKLRNRV